MVKNAGDLEPGDKISFGDGPRLIIATHDLGDKISILLEGGRAEDIFKTTQFHVFEDPEPKQVAREQERNEAERREQKYLDDLTAARDRMRREPSHKKGPDGYYHVTREANRLWAEKNKKWWQKL